jgi:hypothetical protein
VGDISRARELLMEARAKFDRIGYRLGLAQSDVVLGHAEYRAGDMDRACARALDARSTLRELQNPRGEAACERLLSLIALDTDDFPAASAHAHQALKLYEKLQDPWGQVECKLLLAQVSLARGDEGARKLVSECDAVTIDEVEPQQHRHLTRAWLAQREGRWGEAATDLARAREVFDERGVCGDHTPHLIARFARMPWSAPAMEQVMEWVKALEPGVPHAASSHP